MAIPNQREATWRLSTAHTRRKSDFLRRRDSLSRLLSCIRKGVLDDAEPKRSHLGEERHRARLRTAVTEQSVFPFLLNIGRRGKSRGCA